VITLVLGGARSGKSEVAERLCQKAEAVTYIATAVDDGGDPEFAARIALHRARRPHWWTTVEASPGELVGAVQGAGAGSVLVDSLATWMAAAPDFDVDADALGAALTGRTGDVVVVSDEVGLGVHPSTRAGRQFRDRLGALNQGVAGLADRVLLVVAGRVLPLEAL
jgi:adenosyl cobinamide kinase/adenosyl cobinamide phosphate guanylyltransferase